FPTAKIVVDKFHVIQMMIAETVHTHSYGILEAIRTELNNNVAEGLNNKIKTAVKRSYGFKTAKYRNTMIYLVAGKLELPLGLPTQCRREPKDRDGRDGRDW
ncbi:MAG: transposase, partial [Euryarchaeota archaeon]|nr:transposase [Euryarchaeota archaeon]